MTVVVANPDMRGVDALSGGSVLVSAWIFEQMVAESDHLLDLPDIRFVDASGFGFEEAPWLEQRDQVEQLEAVAATSASLDSMILRLAIAAHGGGEDLVQYLMEQWRLAEVELALAKDGGADGGVVSGAVGEDGPVGVADPGGDCADLPCGSEDGDTMGEVGKVEGDQDAGGSPKVPRRRRPGKTRRGGVDATVGAQDSSAA